VIRFLTIALILIALLCGYAIWKSHANDRQAEIDYPALGEFVMVGETRIHYLRQGSGPTVILLHGAGGNLRDFTMGLMAKLTPNYTVLTFDRPGHGFTDTLHNRGESPAEQADVLQAAAKKLGVTQAIIGGYSYGGAVALAWALDYPEMAKGLLLMSAVSNPWKKPPSYMYALAAGEITGPIFATGLSAFAPKSIIEDTLNSLFYPQKMPINYAEGLGVGLSIRKMTLRANGLQVHTLLPHIIAQAKRYKELKLPIEIIHGGQDTTVPAKIHGQVLAQQLPHAQMTFMPKLGHDTQHYAQDEILTALEHLTNSF